ncbi:MAG: hypothetical protein MJY47_05660 [Fibrobacter sp.]|nr:hypothetical protein [Fibrobacter sp.]
MKKVFTLSCGAALLFGLAACSDSSSSDKTPTGGSGDESSIESVEDLPSCGKSSNGKIVEVKDEGSYACVGAAKKWFPAVETADDLPKCSDKRNGSKFYNIEDEEIVICDNGDWESVDPADIDIPGSSDSKDDDEKSSSSKKTDSGEKVVTFEDGIIWTASYKKRARTFLIDDMDEYNFFKVEPVNVGTWKKYVDNLDGGSSEASGKFMEDHLLLDVTLVYDNFKNMETEYYDSYYGEYLTTTYVAPDPYPYGGFSIPLVEDANSEVASVLEIDDTGICVVYEADAQFRIGLTSPKNEDSGFYEYPLAATTKKKIVDIEWSDFKQASWAKTVKASTAMNAVTGIDFKYTNDDTSWSADLCSSAAYCSPAEYSNTMKIYKVGKYGTCDGASEDDSDL